MDDGSTVINQLLEKYSLEGLTMSYTMEQFRKKYVKAHLSDLDPEERLKGLKPVVRHTNTQQKRAYSHYML